MMAIGISFSTNFITYAKIDNILIKSDKSKKLYEYKYDNIIAGAEDDFVGIDAPLYKEYSLKDNKVLAFHDDTNGYIKFENISQAAEDAFVFNTPFNLQQFISNAKDNEKYIVKDDIQVRLLKNGEVVDGELKKKPIIPIVNVKPSPAPGKTMILVELPNDIDSSKYNVYVNQERFRYINDKFVITINGRYTKEEAEKMITIKEKEENDNLKASIEIKSSPAPGKVIVIISLPKNLDASKYSVKLGNEDTRFVNGKFVTTINGTYTEQDINDMLNIILK